MRIVLAPDSFKGSLNAGQVCEMAEAGIRGILPAARIKKIPLADGGEGTLEALECGLGCKRIKTRVTGPVGKKTEAEFAVCEKNSTAIIESARASGIGQIAPDSPDPLRATSRGTGELIRSALDLGCTRIILGIGGSATNDCGAGALQALGFELLDDAGEDIGPGGKELSRLKKINAAGVDPRLHRVKIEIAHDVDNLLLGENGATYTYAPQKGAKAEDLPVLEKGLEHFSRLAKKGMGIEISDRVGSGAAGGLGAGLLLLPGAKLIPGFRLIRENIGLKEKIRRFAPDIILTAEGEINAQTAMGKVPCGVGRIGRELGITVVALAGALGPGHEKAYSCGITAMFSIADRPMSIKTAIDRTPDLVRGAAARLTRLIETCG
ncbi:MAG: glycerate kinase [Desulfonatronovibrionaceae bacterium]